MSLNTAEIIKSSLQESVEAKLKLLADTAPIEKTAQLLIDCLRRGGTVFLIGNGGSAADAQHIAAELVGRFEKDNTLPALALTTDPSCMTALANDFGYGTVFSRQVKALMRPGDLLVAISTSGNSESINLAAQAAQEKGCKVIGLTGKDGGKLKDLCTEAVVVPSQRTCRIQESHITVGHIWCELIEKAI
ncbi:D-sedoheptulose 7-phosphate isomerase [bacterium]|nr:D-sedoheptulose 7-phosphate isomerase [bacterium]